MCAKPVPLSGVDLYLEARSLRASDFANGDTEIQGVGSFFCSEMMRAPAASAVDTFRMIFADVDLKKKRPHASRVQLIRAALETLVMRTYTMVDIRDTTSTKSTALKDVQNNHLDALCQALGRKTWQTTTRTTTNTSMHTLKCPNGAVSKFSSPDGYMLRHLCVNGETPIQFVAGVIEAKGTGHTTTAAIRQAYAESTNVANALRCQGVRWDSVRVPVWATNGVTMQFGVTRLLDPGMPYFTNLSKALDLTDATDCQEAAEILCLLDVVCQEPLHSLVPKSANEGPWTILNTGQYHLKPLDTFFAARDDLDVSLTHFMRLMQKLRDSDAKDDVVAPVTVLTKTAQTPASLVFENLAAAHYQIGLPAEEELAVAYMEAVTKAVNRIHHAGVVHMDLYPSNIMFRVIENPTGVPSAAIDIKIIDWDAAHCINDRFYEPVRTILSNNDEYRKRLLTCDSVMEAGVPDKAVKAWDNSLMRVLQWAVYKADWLQRLSVRNKEELDGAFRDCCFAFLQEKEGAIEEAHGLASSKVL